MFQLLQHDASCGMTQLQILLWFWFHAMIIVDMYIYLILPFFLAQPLFVSGYLVAEADKRCNFD